MTGEAWTLRRRAFDADWRRGGAAGAPGSEDEAGARAAAFSAWLARAHEAQRPPGSAADGGAWSTWLFLGGRGAGKTHAGAAWLSAQARPGARLALVGPTLREVSEVMVRGVSGLVATAAAGARPRWEAGRQRLVWPNGAQAHAFSAEAPEALRGPQFHAAWGDEVCAWRNAEATLANLRLGLRLGNAPRLMLTTTPRPTAVLRRLRAEPGLAETRAGTCANAEHLAPGFVAGLTALYGGTRLAAQELEGQVVEGGGALFTAAMLAAARAEGAEVPAVFEQVVVAVDPPAGAAAAGARGGSACGIVVAGRVGERAWVLGDRSCVGLGPSAWAGRVAATARAFGAHAVIAEANQGGDMVRSVLAAADAHDASGAPVPIRLVRAVAGKRARAEPVAALYEQGRVAHAGAFGALEEELMALGGEDGGEGGGAFDRADALVWAVTALLLERRAEPRVRVLDWAPPRPGVVGV